MGFKKMKARIREPQLEYPKSQIDVTYLYEAYVFVIKRFRELVKNRHLHEKGACAECDRIRSWM